MARLICIFVVALTACTAKQKPGLGTDGVVRAKVSETEAGSTVLTVQEGIAGEVAFLNEADRVISSDALAVRIWDTGSGERIGFLPERGDGKLRGGPVVGKNGTVAFAVFAPTGEGKRLDGVFLWDPAQPTQPPLEKRAPQSLFDPPETVVTLDGLALTAALIRRAGSPVVLLWDLGDDQISPFGIVEVDGAVEVSALSADGQWVASAVRHNADPMLKAPDPREITVWRRGAKDSLWAEPVGTDRIEQMAFTPDNRVLMVRTYEAISFIAAADGKDLGSIAMKRPGTGPAIALSPDSSAIAVAGNGFAPTRIHSLPKGEVLKELKSEVVQPKCIAFTSDGGRVLFASGKQIEVWEL